MDACLNVNRVTVSCRNSSGVTLGRVDAQKHQANRCKGFTQSPPSGIGTNPNTRLFCSSVPPLKPVPRLIMSKVYPADIIQRKARSAAPERPKRRFVSCLPSTTKRLPVLTVSKRTLGKGGHCSVFLGSCDDMRLAVKRLEARDHHSQPELDVRAPCVHVCRLCGSNLVMHVVMCTYVCLRRAWRPVNPPCGAVRMAPSPFGVRACVSSSPVCTSNV